MKYLIIPDIHEKWKKAQKIIDQERGHYDKIVLLGDIFDDYEQDDARTDATIKWISDLVEQPDVQWCIGNHDMHYLRPEEDLKFACSGYRQRTHKAVQAAFPPARLTRLIKSKILVPFVLVEGWETRILLSHAGIGPGQMNKPSRSVAPILKRIETTFHGLLVGPEFSVKSALFSAGDARKRIPDYDPYIGGITWLDWRHEFYHLPGLNQVVGHTKVYNREVREAKDNFHPKTVGRTRVLTNFGSSFNLDTDLKDYAILEATTGRGAKYKTVINFYLVDEEDGRI